MDPYHLLSIFVICIPILVEIMRRIDIIRMNLKNSNTMVSISPEIIQTEGKESPSNPIEKIHIEEKRESSDELTKRTLAIICDSKNNPELTAIIFKQSLCLMDSFKDIKILISDIKDALDITEKLEGLYNQNIRFYGIATSQEYWSVYDRFNNKHNDSTFFVLNPGFRSSIPNARWFHFGPNLFVLSELISDVIRSRFNSRRIILICSSETDSYTQHMISSFVKKNFEIIQALWKNTGDVVSWINNLLIQHSEENTCLIIALTGSDLTLFTQQILNIVIEYNLPILFSLDTPLHFKCKGDIYRISNRILPWVTSEVRITQGSEISVSHDVDQDIIYIEYALLDTILLLLNIDSDLSISLRNKSGSIGPWVTDSDGYLHYYCITADVYIDDKKWVPIRLQAQLPLPLGKVVKDFSK